MSGERQVTVFQRLSVNADELVSEGDGCLHRKVLVPCPRCHGSGYWGHGRGPAARCFRCGGRGSLSALVRVYSADQVATGAWQAE